MHTRKEKTKEYIYIHNMGADGRRIFSSKEDFDRFEAYLYLLNATESDRAANFFAGGREGEIFTSARGENLLAIGAYSIVPRSFHILVTPLVEGGIGKFMQKLQTAYTMYFNKKYAHTGRLFHSAYRSEILNTEQEIKRAHAFIHLQPSVLFDERWEDAPHQELAEHVHRAMEYRYSSIGEYSSSKHVITSPREFPLYMRRVKNAQAHYSLWQKNKKE